MTDGEDARLADDMPAARYFAIERSFWADRHRPNVLLVHYNDLKADLDAEMRRVSQFLGIPVDEQLWPSLVEAARFFTSFEANIAVNCRFVTTRLPLTATGGLCRFTIATHRAAVGSLVAPIHRPQSTELSIRRSVCDPWRRISA